MQLAMQQIVFNEVKIRFCPAIGVTLHVYGGSDLAAFEAKHKLSDYSAAASVEGHTLCVVCPGIHLASNMFTGVGRVGVQGISVDLSSILSYVYKM